MKFNPTLLLVLMATVSLVSADLYMQNPPGNNDRCRERNQNRNNANREFDSQNNAAGGYPWRGDPTTDSAPDPITYYHNSMLRLEWTMQHQCGGTGDNQNVHCQFIVQYACENDMPGLRDGYPEGAITESDNNNAGYKTRSFSGRGGQNQDGTNTIPTDKDSTFYAQGLLGGIEFGYHESITSYQLCQGTSRNKGLYTSDQQLNGNDARFTRQNPNGGRRGLECPEERDYYPYWRSSQWRDVALLVSDPSWCGYYQSHSENVAGRSYCNCPSTCVAKATNNLIPITAAACTTAGGTWSPLASKGMDVPYCGPHPVSRDNHLGNSAPIDGDGNIVPNINQPEMAHMNLLISPNMGSQLCVLRMRYNMSTADYPAMDFAYPGSAGVGFDALKNCPRVSQNANSAGVDDGSGNAVANPQCTSALTLNSRPLYNRPYVGVFDPSDIKLSLAINTHQTGRTFQDRSYVFRVAPPPDGVGTVWNLNFRGRRGNIVQAYPAVEYDFVPNRLTLAKGDFLHIQLHGSDFNTDRNANNGEGWRFSDRTNLVQSAIGHLNYPLYKSEISMFDNTDIAKRFALLGQDISLCAPFKDGDNNEQNSITNCGKLNRAPNRFPPIVSNGLVQMNNVGTFHYFSTRNNNFSNRSQKGFLEVTTSGLSAAAIAGIVIGTLAGVGLLSAGVCFYGKRNPNSVAGGWYAKTIGRIRGGSPTTANTAAARPAPAPDMEYVRH